jgi:ATP-dependent DNA ligase
MKLPVAPPFPPMEAKHVAELPAGEMWAYEPKWDGFRCLAFRDDGELRLQSKAGKPLERYFPEVAAFLLGLGARRFVLDGELVVPVDGALSFDALLQRLHPAESRVRRLAARTPALFIAFDVLLAERGHALVGRPLRERRRRLEAFIARYAADHDDVRLSPQTEALAAARRWLDAKHGGLDGVMAKRLDMPYRSGERDAMLKIKRMRTVDCVVAGFRYHSRRRQVGSLLLGLYDGGDGLLHHVGFTSSLRDADRAALTTKLERLAGGAGFTGRAPGGPSRWSTARSAAWTPLAPKLVVEVEYDHFTQGRFRHGTRLVRWRPDKAPRQCTFAQLETEGASSLRLL